MTKLVALPCKIGKGNFSSERLFVLTLANGETYKSVAPFLHFWNSNQERLRKNEPEHDSIDGFIAAILLEKAGDKAYVEIPDEEVIQVKASDLVSRPQEVDTNVPVGS